jgi:hypothetical protein
MKEEIDEPEQIDQAADQAANEAIDVTPKKEEKA